MSKMVSRPARTGQWFFNFATHHQTVLGLVSTDPPRMTMVLALPNLQCICNRSGFAMFNRLELPDKFASSA
jgi:hypothetical protein